MLITSLGQLLISTLLPGSNKIRSFCKMIICENKRSKTLQNITFIASKTPLNQHKCDLWISNQIHKLRCMVSGIVLAKFLLPDITDISNISNVSTGSLHKLVDLNNVTSNKSCPLYKHGDTIILWAIITMVEFAGMGVSSMRGQSAMPS